MLRGRTPSEVASERMFIDAETGQVFEHTVVAGEIEPIKAPSGKNTGYEAEKCYWAKDANGKWKAKLKPTYVLLKIATNPKSREKTYCPDCGHEVRPHNPLPPPAMMAAAKEEAEGKKN
jgi:hypothetical protein